MNDRIDGIVVRQTDYRENSVIISVLTKNHGKISLTAAGARKMTSKNAAGLLPYTENEYQLDYQENKTMFRLKTAVPIHTYRHMHEDLEASSAAAVLAETADAFCLNEDAAMSGLAFDLLEQSFDLLNQSKSSASVLAIALSDLLTVAGIGPIVDECVQCQSQQIVALSAEAGGFLCASCARRLGIGTMPVKSLSRFRRLVKANLSQLDAVEKAGGAELEDIEILMQFILIHGGIKIRSFPFYQRVISIERGT